MNGYWITTDEGYDMCPSELGFEDEEDEDN